MTKRVEKNWGEDTTDMEQDIVSVCNGSNYIDMKYSVQEMKSTDTKGSTNLPEVHKLICLTDILCSLHTHGYQGLSDIAFFY